jgi:hypothetical protein
MEGVNIVCCAVQQRADAIHIRSAQGAGRKGYLKHEMRSVIGQKTRGVRSCSEVPANGVVMVVGWQQERG